MPYLAKRHVLEERGDLEPRIPLISDDILDAIDEDDDADGNGDSDADGGKLRFKKSKEQEKSKEKISTSDGKGSSNNASLSIEETNALRAKLGLKPLQ